MMFRNMSFVLFRLLLLLAAMCICIPRLYAQSDCPYGAVAGSVVCSATDKSQIVVQGATNGISYSLYKNGAIVNGIPSLAFRSSKMPDNGMIFFTNMEVGTYTVKATNTSNPSCPQFVGTASIIISVDPPAAGRADPWPSDAFSKTFCDANQNSLTITAGSGANYQWYLDGHPYSNTATFTFPFNDNVYGAPGTHTVSVTYQTGGGTQCSPSGTVVTVDGMPVKIVATPRDIAIKLNNPNPNPNYNPNSMHSYEHADLVVFPSHPEYTYQWLKGVTVVGLNQSTYSATESGAYYVNVSNQGCNTKLGPIDIVVNSIPVANAGPDQTLVLPVNSTTLAGSATDVDGTIKTQKWFQASGSPALISTTSANTITVSNLKIGANQFYFAVSDDMNEYGYDDVVVTVEEPPNNYNWVKETTVLEKSKKDDVAVNALQIQSGQKSVNWNYVDGLGRPMQNVVVQGSPLKADVVQPMAYDAFGRETIKYLPYVSEQTDGSYKKDAIGVKPENYATSPQHQFYNRSNSNIAYDQEPRAQTVFEPSSLNRILTQGAPGTVWQPNDDVLLDKTVHYSYQLNLADEVFLFTYDPLTGLVNLGVNAARYYKPNMLHKTKTTDEHKNEVVEYVDNEGRTVCKKVQYGADTNSNKLYASTYYLYDDFGNLIMVLPPEATEALTN